MSTTKPVALDETLQRLVEAILSQNAGQRELRDLMEKQNKLLEGITVGESEIYFAPIKCTATTADGVTTYAYAFDGIGFDDIFRAYQSGKFVILCISSGEDVYFATFADFKNLTVPIGGQGVADGARQTQRAQFAGRAGGSRDLRRRHTDRDRGRVGLRRRGTSL